jgi:hypothetical protein
MIARVRALPLAAALALAAAPAPGCKSSAPYTIPAAAINTGLALGMAGAQRANGGCYAVCTNGTVCNARTGLCESAAPLDQYCEPDPAGGVRCVPVAFPAVGKEQQKAGAASGSPVGISPATGQAPPPPSEASPRGPDR